MREMLKLGGNVTFFIDGYYLAQVPVVNGKATWKEMIGSTPVLSRLFMFPTPLVGCRVGFRLRWNTPPARNPLPPPIPPRRFRVCPKPASSDPAPAFDTQPYTPKALSYTVDVKSISDSRLNTTITLSDSKVKPISMAATMTRLPNSTPPAFLRGNGCKLGS